MDLAALTIDHFAGRAGESFRDAETGAELELLAVEDSTETYGHVPEGRRAPFSLLFRGPGETPLPQSIRTLRNDGLGELAIFLVPVARDDAGYRYQAVFS